MSIAGSREGRFGVPGTGDHHDPGDPRDESPIPTHGRIFTFRQLAGNLLDKLLDKLTDAGLRDDLAQIVVEPPGGYHIDQAANLVMERLGVRLANAPADRVEVVEGAWRRRTS